MGIKIDIKANDLKTLLALLQQYLPNTLVWAFGSRVKFTSKPASDLDLVAFITEKQKMSFSLLKDALAESALPFRIDLHDWNDIPENFRKNIEASYLVIQDVAKRELPKDWKTFKLSELINVKHGFAFKGEFFSDEPTTNILLSPGNFKIGGGFKSDKFKYYNGEYPKDYILKEGDILITMTDLSKAGDTLGYSAKIPPHNGINYLHNQRLGLVQFKNDEIDHDFLYWILRTQSYQYYIVGSATGSTVKHTSPTRICSYEFEAPIDKNKQKEIAQTLTSLDDKIDLNLQMNQTLEAMAQALFKEWFVDFRFPGFDGKFENGLPKGWRKGKLASVCEIKYGKDHKHLGDGNIPVYGSGGIMRYADKALFEQESILIPRKGTLSNLFYISKPFWSVDTMFYTIIKQESIRKYLFYLLKSLNLTSMNVGSAVPSLTTEVLNKIEIIIPNDKTLLKFEEIISGFYAKMEENNNQNQTLTETRDILLPKLMSGQMEIK